MAMNFESRYTDVVPRGRKFRLSGYLAAIVRSWRIIVVAALIGGLAGAIYAFFASPVYRADVIIQVTESNQQDNGGGNANAMPAMPAASQMSNSRSTTAAEIELLRSRASIEDTVKKLHLDISARPHYFPVIGAAIGGFIHSLHTRDGQPLAPWLSSLTSSFASGAEDISVSKFDTPKNLYNKNLTLTAAGAGEYVLSDPDGVEILRGTVGHEAKGAGAFGDVTLLVDRMTGTPGSTFELSRASTLDTVAALQRRLSVVETALHSGVVQMSLEGQDSELIAKTVNDIVSRFVQQDLDTRSTEVGKTLAFLEQQLPQVRAQLHAAEASYKTFRSTSGVVDVTEGNRLLLQQAVDNKTKLLGLQQQRAELSQRFTSSYPAVAALDAQIAAVTKAQEAVTKSFSVLPDTEQDAARLSRDVRANTELLANLQNKIQDLRMAKAGQVGNVRVVDFAEAPDSPVRPKRLTVILFSTAGGLMLGVLLAFARKSVYGGVERPEEIEDAVGVRVFAIVPRSTQQLHLQQKVSTRTQGLHVLASTSPEDAAVEGMRGLRTSLQLQMADSRNNVLMLTGSRPNAGKSFVSVNLATLVASTRKRVLLIDGDMRRGDVHSHFGVRHAPGLSDVLMGSDIEAALLHDVSPGVDLLTKGSLPVHPSELLMSDRMQEVLDYLKLRYDLVIIDTPPVLAVTDSTLIGRHAGTSLLVVRHGFNQVEEINETVKRLNLGGVSMKGILLTDVPQSKLMSGSAYTSYYNYESIPG
ncbi:polysaccharide biosynthesis tyrosine autokinase [Caballeronia sp. LjRoot29]|uniref:polysaccharide biosynthesis tyrosine autokinase n=1 Tax=Caballeronia sp. LjRoot29 TaxID=3342315 RepID=UPI003ECDAB97